MLDLSGIMFQVLDNLSLYVFGNMALTTISMVIFLTLISLLIQIPFPYAIAIQLPLIVILTAYNFMPLLVGGIFAGVYLVFAVVSFYNGIGLDK